MFVIGLWLSRKCLYLDAAPLSVKAWTCSGLTVSRSICMACSIRTVNTDTQCAFASNSPEWTPPVAVASAVLDVAFVSVVPPPSLLYWSFVFFLRAFAQTLLLLLLGVLGNVLA